MENIYIFGHRNPDTDSICSTIGLSYLKNQLGGHTLPKAIGHLNNETKFVLDYFKVDEPQYLNDVRIRVKDLKYDKKGAINENGTLFTAYNMMQDQHITGVPLISDKKLLTGFVTMKDLAKYMISGNREVINTSLESIISVLEANIITKYVDNINGKIVSTGYRSTTLHDEVKLCKEDILIVGDRYKVLDYAIDSKIELIILANNSNIEDDLIKKAKENKVTIIRSNMSSFVIANRISLSNPIKSINENNHPVTINENDFYTDFQALTSKTNHTNYPVLNNKGECTGLISLSWPNSYDKQKVILVDHNTFAQSVEGIEEADIVEIIDHHNLGAIGTNIPINFRSMPVGCTATMIYHMYLENKISVPKNIAGLLVSAILSDTLLLTSPTTTELDKEAASKLAKIANIDIQKYGYDMLKASSSIKGMSVTDQIYNDYKSYTVGNGQIGIGQLITMDFDEISKDIQTYVDKLNEMTQMDYSLVALFITDIIKNGSYIIYNSKAEDIIKDSFNLKEVYEGVFVKGMVSRKKQMLPAILDIMEK